MGLADEFTVEMACFVTGDADAKQILSALTEQNAFIKCLEDGVTYRFHHMMKECAERAFAALDGEKQTVYHTRFGEWYEARRRYLHAMTPIGAAATTMRCCGWCRRTRAFCWPLLPPMLC